MTYYESAEDMTISTARAKREVEKHGSSWADFIADVGEQTEYEAQDVLSWLGY